MPRAIVRPLQRLLEHEAAGGLVMLVTAGIAVAWANSSWSATYFDLWGTPVRLEVGSLLHLDHLSLQTWVNDALMTVFFLLVGLEIKREIVHGELRDARSVTLPVVAALGGMILPAVIYWSFNAGSAGAEGWGIPMATDIAFAVGVVTLLGSRVPLTAKVFLLTLAVADDIGAVVIIAVFYTNQLTIGWLLAALGGLVVIVAMRRGDVQSLVPYLAVGSFIWLAMLESGVHPTLTGVALGLLTPAWPLRSPRRFPRDARRLLDRIERGYYDRVLTQAEYEENEHLLAELATLSQHTTSPLERLERRLSPWVAYVIVPVFALANAGVPLSGTAVSGLITDSVTLGVIVGLVGGKMLGVFLATALAVNLGLAPLPAGMTWRHILGVATCAGIGFTVALFVATLSFSDPALIDAAKVGILAASALAGTVGYAILRGTGSPGGLPAPALEREENPARLLPSGSAGP